jgi:hypothetical protein
VDDKFVEKIGALGELSEMQVNALFSYLDTHQDSAIDYTAKRERLNTMLENLELAYLAGDLGELAKARPHYLSRKQQLEDELADVPQIVEEQYDLEPIKQALLSFSQLILEDGLVIARQSDELMRQYNILVQNFTERVELDLKSREIKLVLLGEGVVWR